MYCLFTYHCVTWVGGKLYFPLSHTVWPILLLSVFQEQEENKSATSWPEYYIDQLNSMAAVSNNMNLILLSNRNGQKIATIAFESTS